MKTGTKIVLIAAAAILGTNALAARQVADPAKREPPPRAVAVPGEADNVQVQDPRTETPLPKIELPEYVITGTASIDLPAAEKMTPVEDGVFTSDGESGSGRREAFEQSTRLAPWSEQLMGALPETRARIQASLGTFMTPGINGWFAQRYERFDYGISASYSKTGGFIPYTNRSGGSMSVDGGYLLSAENPYFDAARISASLAYASQTYRLYGSVDSSAKRTTDGSGFQAAFSSSIKSPWQYRAGLAYSAFAVKESTLSARQNLAEFSGAADIPTPVVPVTAELAISLATRSAFETENTSLVRVGIESQRAWWGSFFAQAGLHLFFAKGMADQKLTRLYPSAAVGYQFPSVHTFTAAYQGDVRFSLLEDLVRDNPYLVSTSTIQHLNTPVRLTGVLESEWSQSMVTRLTLRWEQRKDEPLYSDSTGRGLWDLEYLGATSRLEAELEAFANISSIGYFALSIVGRSSTISRTSVGVPYLPEAEVSVLYRHEFPAGVSLVPRLSVFGRRNTSPRDEQYLDGYVIAGLRAEYSPLKALAVFVDIDNLVDVRYEIWKGYRGHPFLMTAGISYTW